MTRIIVNSYMMRYICDMCGEVSEIVAATPDEDAMRYVKWKMYNDKHFCCKKCLDYYKLTHDG